MMCKLAHVIHYTVHKTQNFHFCCIRETAYDCETECSFVYLIHYKYIIAAVCFSYCCRNLYEHTKATTRISLDIGLQKFLSDQNCGLAAGDNSRLLSSAVSIVSQFDTTTIQKRRVSRIFIH